MVGLTLHHGTLFAQTDRATTHALDAETGRTLWIAHVGAPDHPATPPAANDDFVAVTVGSYLFMLDRATGREMARKRLSSAESAGCVIGSSRVFVPLFDGRIEAYDFEDINAQPLVFSGAGVALAAPTTTASGLCWGTDRGFIYMITQDTLAARFRFETDRPVTARITARAPYIYAGSRDGFVYAIHQLRGETRWRFSTGEPIDQPIVALDGAIYAILMTGGMYRLDGETGEETWFAPEVRHFISASPTRLYVTDSVNRLRALDIETGARLDTMSTERLTVLVPNVENDRLYLATEGGLIQCLHEVELEEPAAHQAVVALPDEEEAAGDGSNP